MNNVHMHTLDLNLLRVFDALLEERSVTRAGARLGLSQSAVSHALSRLRRVIGDDLFTRTASGMTPTPRARDLGPGVHAALAHLQAALAPPHFDPLVSDRRFVVVAGGYACAVVVPDLVARMNEVAPRCELVVIEAAPDPLDQLDLRRADFVMGASRALPNRFGADVVVEDTLVWAVRRGHPLTRSAVDLETLAATQQVLIGRDRALFDEGRSVQAAWDEASGFEAALRAKGLTRRIGVTVPDSYSALSIIRRSNMAALIPRRLAIISLQAGFIETLETPYQSPTVSLALMYLRERLGEPALGWMQGLILEISSTLP
jgi:DNA-binding transcriptional LysR family regulator